MRKRLLPWLLAYLALATGVALAADDDELVLQFPRMDLSDGRKLKNVVVKSYDAKSEKLLVVADGKAMTVPLALLPAPFNETLKGAPAAGGSVSTVASPARPRPVAQASSQYFLENRVVTPARPPAPVFQPTPGAPTPSSQMNAQIIKAGQEKAARDRAQRYYTYEYPASMTLYRVTLLDIELDTPRTIPGWEGRTLVQGKAYVELYNRSNRSLQRTTSNFEVTLEQKPDESLKAVDFTVKN